MPASTKAKAWNRPVAVAIVALMAVQVLGAAVAVQAASDEAAARSMQSLRDAAQSVAAALNASIGRQGRFVEAVGQVVRAAPSGQPDALNASLQSLAPLTSSNALTHLLVLDAEGNVLVALGRGFRAAPVLPPADILEEMRGAALGSPAQLVSRFTEETGSPVEYALAVARGTETQVVVADLSNASLFDPLHDIAHDLLGTTDVVSVLVVDARGEVFYRHGPPSDPEASAALVRAVAPLVAAGVPNASASSDVNAATLIAVQATPRGPSAIEPPDERPVILVSVPRAVALAGVVGNLAGALAVGAVVLLAAAGIVAWQIIHSNRKLLQAHAAVERSEERFRALVVNSADAIVLIDAGGRVTYASPSVRQLFGHIPEELVGTSIFDHVQPDAASEAKAAFGRVLGGETVELDIPARARDGSTRITAVRASNQLRNPAVGGIVANVRDVTELRRAEAAQREAAEREERLRSEQAMDRMRAEFVNRAAHELSTPLTPMLLQADLLLGQRKGPLPEPALESVRSIQRGARRLQRLTTLLVAAVEAGGPLPQGRLDLAGVVRAVVRDAAPAAEQAHVALSAEAAQAMEVSGDERTLRTIFEHIVDNALRFTPAGGRVEVHAEKEDGDAVVRVADTGVGFRPDEAAQLFQPFAHTAAGEAAEAPGPGLGLHVARLLAARHGGRIEAESPGPGRGATFTVRIPLAAAGQHDAPATQAATTSPPARAMEPRGGR